MFSLSSSWCLHLYLMSAIITNVISPPLTHLDIYIVLRYNFISEIIKKIQIFWQAHTSILNIKNQMKIEISKGELMVSDFFSFWKQKFILLNWYIYIYIFFLMKSPCLLKQLWNTKTGVLRWNKTYSDIWLSYSFDNEEKIRAHSLNISQSYRGSLALFFKFPSSKATNPSWEIRQKAVSKKKYMYL